VTIPPYCDFLVSKQTLDVDDGKHYKSQEHAHSTPVRALLIVSFVVNCYVVHTLFQSTTVFFATGAVCFSEF